jgi:hypothetical protein
MASAWGNVFQSLGESSDRRAQIAREERQRAEDKAFQLKQFLAQEEQRHQDQAQRERQNQLESARIQASNIAPDAAGSAGSIDLNDPRLKAFEGAGSVYNRAVPGKTLGATTSPFASAGAGQTTAPKPTGKFTWTPSWEQQQQIDQRQEHLSDVGASREFEQKMLGLTQGGQERMQKGQENFQAGQNSIQRAFQAQQTARELAARTEDIKLQLGPKLSTNQTIGIHMLEQAAKLLDPDAMLTMANQAYQLLGVPNPNGAAPGGPAGPNDPLNLHGGGAPTAPVAPTAPPNVNQFLDKNAPPNSQVTTQKKPLGWEDIQRIMGNLPRR